MLFGLYLAVGVCVAAVGWALIPSQSTVRLPGAIAMEQLRNPFASLLGTAGKFLKLPGRQGERLKGRLLYTASRLSVEEFIGVRLFASVAAGGLALVVLKEFGTPNPLFLGLAAVVGFMIPEAWLRARIAKRQRAMTRLLPEVVDLLSLCIGAGLDFLGSLNKVVFLKQFRKEPLIEELSMALQEIKFGKRRAEALRAMAKRVNVPELSSFVRTIVQADRMGTPIAEVLTIQSEDVRIQRFMSAERAALKAPIKILIPLIFFIMPCVAIIIGAPIFIQFMRQNPFAK